MNPGPIERKVLLQGVEFAQIVRVMFDMKFTPRMRRKEVPLDFKRV